MLKISSLLALGAVCITAWAAARLPLAPFPCPCAGKKAPGARRALARFIPTLHRVQQGEEDAPENVPALGEQTRENRAGGTTVCACPGHVKPTTLSVRNARYLREEQLSGCFYFQGEGAKAQPHAQPRCCCGHRPQDGSGTPEFFG